MSENAPPSAVVEPASGPAAPATSADAARAVTGRDDWRILVTIFWITGMVEGIGVSQIYALVPSLLRGMGVAEADRLALVGLASALVFLVGLPIVPLWGVWADKLSRKVVIVRSALVATVVFAGIALAREPWQLALSMVLMGFQLGNTGIMLAGIRDVVPLRRVGTIIAVFGVAGPIGFAVGPVLAGLLIDRLDWPITSVFWLSAAFALGTALLVWFGSREVRPEVVPDGSVLHLAFGALRTTLGDPAVRRIFAIFGLSFLAGQMIRPYLPVLVEGIAGTGPGLASAIGLVVGLGALVGALMSPFGGVLGDRIGFRRVLVTALAGGCLVLLTMTLVGTIPGLAVLSVGLAACTATIAAMVFSLLATEVPVERRSATLNLVYLPLYAAGIIGPALGALVAASVGVHGPFLLGSAVFAIGAVAIARRRPSAT